MNEKKKLELENEFLTNASMISVMKKAGKNPNKYINQAKKLLKKLERVDPDNAWMYKKTLEGKMKG